MKAQPNSRLNSVVSIFEISAEAHKALTELKAYQSDVGTLMAQALLIKKTLLSLRSIAYTKANKSVVGQLWAVCWGHGWRQHVTHWVTN